MSAAKVSITFVQALVREVDVDGTLVVVRTADMDQILAMVGHTEPLQGELAQAPASVIDAISGYELDDAEKAAVVTWLLGLVARHRDAIKAIVSIAVVQPPEFVGKLLPDRFLALLLLSLEVNADFFSQALKPLAAMAAALQIPGLGAAAATPGPAELAGTAAPPSTGQPPSSS